MFFRFAVKYGLLDQNEVERWLNYRDYRNKAVHDYGYKIGNEILEMLDVLLPDIKNLIKKLEP